MEAYFALILSFPTIIYTLLLCVCVILGLLTVLGALGTDANADVGCDACDVGHVGDIGHIGSAGHISDVSLTVDTHLDANINDASSAAQAVGILTRLGLNGVPITIVITLLSLFGWVISYLVQAHFLSSITSPLIYYGTGTMLMISSFMISTFITAQFCKPLRKVFKPSLGIRKNQLLGQTVIIDSLSVDMNYGAARYENKGVNMHLKVRASENNAFNRGDRAVLLQYNAVQDHYMVISEEEFLNAKTPRNIQNE